MFQIHQDLMEQSYSQASLPCSSDENGDKMFENDKLPIYSGSLIPSLQQYWDCKVKKAVPQAAQACMRRYMA